MSKTMAEVLAEHTPVDSSTDGVPEDEIWCNSIECGFKMERSNDYDETQEFAAHQAAALSAAGFGLVADAKAERGWLAKTRNTDGSIAIIGHFKTEAEAEKWAGKYPSSFVEPS